MQKAMSALPPIATMKADSRRRSCLLYTRKRTCAVQLGMSALGQERTSGRLFDHLVGLREQRRRHGEAEPLGGLQINHHFEFGRRLHWQIGGLLAFKNAIDVTGSLPV